MMQSLVGQYECAHRSAVGLDYFTARLDRLTLYANGRFSLITQEKSRLAQAAKSFIAGQQAGGMEAPETHAEGTYSAQGDQLFLRFDSGEQERGTVQETGVQFGKDFFEKVSDTTFMPPPQRMKSNMEDIAKGLKIASAIGGTVLKAAKTIQDTLQSAPPPQQQADAQSPAAPAATPAQPAAPGAPSQQAAGYAPQQTPGYGPSQAQASYTPPQANQGQGYVPDTEVEALFCDQCGAPVRPGKKFCNKCGARLV